MYDARGGLRRRKDDVPEGRDAIFVNDGELERLEDRAQRRIDELRDVDDAVKWRCRCVRPVEAMVRRSSE